MNVRYLHLLVGMLFISSVGMAMALQPAPRPMRPVEPEKARAKRSTRDRQDEDAARRRRQDVRDQRDGRRNIKPRRSDRDRVRWQLGVTGKDTDAGVVVERVIANSAASRAGFERDDVIVTVNGYQVGVVDGVLFDLGDELQQQADDNGVVTMLIQNRRDRRLENVRVQLDRAGGFNGPNRTIVTGTVSYRERIALPPRCVLSVELVELDRRGQRIRTVDSRRVAVGSQNTIAFELNYDARDIIPNRRYAVEARIRDDARTIMQNRSTYYVLTDNAPSHVDIRVQP